LTIINNYHYSVFINHLPTHSTYKYITYITYFNVLQLTLYLNFKTTTRSHTLNYKYLLLIFIIKINTNRYGIIMEIDEDLSAIEVDPSKSTFTT